jgi:hypothetical protein
VPRAVSKKLMEFLEKKKKGRRGGEARELSGARLHAARGEKDAPRPVRDRVPGMARKGSKKNVKKVQRLGQLKPKTARERIAALREKKMQRSEKR